MRGLQGFVFYAMKFDPPPATSEECWGYSLLGGTADGLRGLLRDKTESQGKLAAKHLTSTLQTVKTVGP